MALAETTLSAAVAASGESVIQLASLTGIAAGRVLKVDDEVMKVTKGYTAVNPVPVLRGQDGTSQAAHVSSARVVHGDGSDWPVAPGLFSIAPMFKSKRQVSYSTTATLTLPAAGEDLFVVLHGSAFTLTVPVPTKELDGCEITFTGAAGAAYVLEFTGGLGGASTNYETITFNATGAVAFKAIAYNETWRVQVAAGLTGTATNTTGGIG